MAALGLQVQHHRRQFLGSHFAPSPLMADIPVLAEFAAQIAAAEKNRSRAFPAAQNVFFAVMGAVAVNDSARSDTAYCALNGLEAINVTIARAEIAILQILPGKTGARHQFTAFKQGQITGLKVIKGFFS
jgi:hypothetical protein